MLSLPAMPQRAYWQQQLSYTIDVSLNDVEHTLDGFIKIKYTNHSPDTLPFIWFHLWPNAFRNDRTAYSEQLLQHGSTEFYFSDKDQKGYINRLDFRVDGRQARMEDHPLYIDVVKIWLPKPLAPGDQAEITTPFHEKIPFNFNRGGHIGQAYQIIHWYPRPAVYDQKGWHEMPYLDQGELYGEWGDYKVSITLPANYAVAATGELQDPEEIKWLRSRSAPVLLPPPPKAQAAHGGAAAHKAGPPAGLRFPPSGKAEKTLVFKQEQTVDFAWYADKRYQVRVDSLQMPSGSTLSMYCYSLPGNQVLFQKGIEKLKSAMLFHSKLLGDYPYRTMSVVETPGSGEGSCSAPMVACVPAGLDERHLDLRIGHETGLIWLTGLISPDANRYPWMDKGLNDYYDKRYADQLNRSLLPLHAKPAAPAGVPSTGLERKFPEDREKRWLDIILAEHTDQPLSGEASGFSPENFRLVAGAKARLWTRELEDSLGRAGFDSAMHRYFTAWLFRHPYPGDLQEILQQSAGGRMDIKGHFSLLDQTGPLNPGRTAKKIRPAFLFSARNTEQYRYLSFSPAAGYNYYDQLMIGALIHNYNLPPERFQFLVAPLYATGSKQLSGLGRVSYSWYPSGKIRAVELSAAGSKFQTNQLSDSNNVKIFEGFTKIAPALRLHFRPSTAVSTVDRWLEFKTYFITERSFDPAFVLRLSDSTLHPSALDHSFRYLNQITFQTADNRVLYPYSVQGQLQQASQFYRMNLTINYFFNYAGGGGMDVRFFAAKFGQIGSKTLPLELDLYKPKLTASRGNEDYTYSNYFIGRNEFTGLASQQIMVRDGALKLRTDVFQDLQGRSANWIAAANFSTTLPAHLFPVKLPLKLFLDVGTYAEAWGTQPPTSKFLYVGGLQLSLFKNILNIYAPLVYSSDFSSQLKGLAQENTFAKKISFSIDLQNMNRRKWLAFPRQ